MTHNSETTPEAHLTLLINEQEYAVDIPEGEPLLWVLRDDLGLTRTKPGCDEGVCGCCLVLIDGQPVTSCTQPAHELAGREIRTIEGIVPQTHSASDVSTVQRAFLDA